VDAASGERLAGACLGPRPHVARTVVAYPDELLAFWRSQGRPVSALPALDASCRDIPSEDPPRIVSPAGTTPYRLRRDAPSAFQRIPLIARASAEAERLWWYQDGVLVASGAPSRSLFLDPRRGSHRIVVVDGAGRSDALTYTVE
jgi:penicillin-binding protein 1C